MRWGHPQSSRRLLWLKDRSFTVRQCPPETRQSRNAGAGIAQWRTGLLSSNRRVSGGVVPAVVDDSRGALCASRGPQHPQGPSIPSGTLHAPQGPSMPPGALPPSWPHLSPDRTHLWAEEPLGSCQGGSWEHWPGWMHREHLAGWGLQALEPLLCCPVLFQIQVAEAVHSPSSPGSETTSCQQFSSPSPTGFHFCAFRPAPPHSLVGGWGSFGSGGPGMCAFRRGRGRGWAASWS